MKNLSELTNNQLRDLLRETRRNAIYLPVDGIEFKNASKFYVDLNNELRSRAEYIKHLLISYNSYVGNYEPQKPSILSQIKTFFKNLYA